ncbi:MAG TPA: ABC transporter ATP-binding protein [Anaerovoracaceae bacterium]|nr:ABC transporter ATP-binding protein [Anaerovoracaceae bacterium]
MITRLFDFFDGYRKYAVLAPLTIVGETVLEVIIPFLMAKIIDVGIQNGDMQYVLTVGGIMVAMALSALILGAAAGRFAAVAAMGFARNLRHGLFEKVQDFSFYNIDKFGTASLITRLTTDITNTQNVVMMVLRMLVRAPIMLICATCFAIYINASLSLIFFVAIPILAVGLSLIMSKAFPKFQIMLRHYDNLNSIVLENLTAIRVVKAYVREGEENEKFRGAAEKLRNSQRQAEKLVIFSMPMMQLIMYTCMVSIVWFGGNMIISETMGPGELMGFLSYVTQILMSLMMVAMVFINIVISKASVGRILEILEEKIDIPEKTEMTKDIKDIVDSSICFDNVSFSYVKDKDNTILSDINLKIDSGEAIGIIGGTGSGKSSLVQLIPRLYDVTTGNVFLAGINVKEYPLKELRNKVAMVLQNNVLFSGTIRDNLRWGNELASDVEMVEACMAASAHEFISAFPEGYDTVLGQGGVNLSGGQKQRICIARALLKNPNVIILDDSTSAVDTDTDSKIRTALSEKLSDTTTIIISQRIASVMDADRIIVMDDGRINGIGNHNELLDSNTIYREVYESQRKGVEL